MPIELQTCRWCRNGYRRARKCPECNGRGYHVAGQENALQVILKQPLPPPVPKPKPQFDSNQTYWKRRANVQCARCGNPQLETETLCKTCADYFRKVLNF